MTRLQTLYQKRTKFKIWKNTRKKSQAILLIKTRLQDYLCKDPITLTRIKNPVSVIRNNVRHIYDADSLYRYIHESGDFFDPIARKEFDTCELLRISNRTGKLNLNNLKEELVNKHNENIVNAELCQVFECELSEQISLLRNEETYDNNILRIVVPVIIQCFDNFKVVNVYRCKLFIRSLFTKISTDEPLPNADINLKISHLLALLLSYCH